MHKNISPFDPDLVEIMGQFNEMDGEFPDKEELSDPEEDDLDDKTEIREISVLEHFIKTLQKAQEVAVEAEREHKKGNKRPRRYDGSSKRTQRRHNFK